ncbi:MAG: LamG domain-containing protein, partial [Patescibacteria group bacterium]|nr:LamG domain-containing protein [Patescibacteria group bacterium]
VSNGLVGWWTMDGNNLIQNVKDSSGQGNNGSLVGFSATSSAEVAGKIGGALKFNGTSQYITVPDTTALRLSGTYSVSVWIRPAALKDYGNVLFKESLISNTGYGLITFANGSWGWQIGNTLDIQTSAALLKNTTWSLLIATYDGTNVRLYQNGSLLSTTVASAVASDATALALGADTGDGRYFNGTIDDVRVYNRALSASEIQALYAAGR